jgi:glycogen(starch) synthase
MTADAVGGVWTYAVELIAALGEDAEIVLATCGPAPGRAQREQLRRLPLSAYEHRGYALEWMAEPWDDVARAGEWLAELREQHDAELVHLNAFAHGAMPFGVPVVVVGHSCVLSWHEAVRGRPAGPEWDRYRREVSEGIAGADVLVAPTAAMLDALVRLYEPAAETIVVPNGIGDGAYAPRDKRPYVLGVGRAWDEAKNLGALERVAPELPWPVRVAGAGGSLGHVSPEALRALYGHAAVFAEPARYEPFGLAALEAGRAACALVLGDIPSLREVWGGAAVYVDPFDDDALAAALLALTRDETRTAALGAAARDRARSFTGEAMGDAYLDLYAGLREAAPVGATR